MISKSYFKAKFEQLSQTREESVLKNYKLRYYGSSIDHIYGNVSSY